MKVILTGHSRVGTAHSATFFSRFGIASYHQKGQPKRDKTRIYDLAEPPRWALEYIDFKAGLLMEKDREGFESDWELVYYILHLHRRLPHIRWLVMLRDPKEVGNSLKKKGVGLPITDLATHYNEVHSFLLEQVLRIPSVHRPRYMNFRDYFRGKYTVALLMLFGIRPTDENVEKARAVLGEKINANPPYKEEDAPLYGGYYHQKSDSIFEIGRSLNRCLRASMYEFVP